MKKIADVKKMENGKLAVRWQGGKKFFIINDADIAKYLIYLVTRSEQTVMENVNSMCR